MFSPIGRTSYDVNFQCLRIPVQVHPGFWLVSLVMGASTNRIDLIITWIGCVFLSILVHELGHALAARPVATNLGITLYHFGGLASYTPRYGYTRNRAIWISFAGPAAGFVLFAAVCVLEAVIVHLIPFSHYIRNMLSGDRITPLEFAIVQLKYINLFWGLVNLLPVLPLDGGKICLEYLSSRNSYTGQIRAQRIGMFVGGATAAAFFAIGQMYPALLFAGLAIENYRQVNGSQHQGW